MLDYEGRRRNILTIYLKSAHCILGFSFHFVSLFKVDLLWTTMAFLWFRLVLDVLIRKVQIFGIPSVLWSSLRLFSQRLVSIPKTFGHPKKVHVLTYMQMVRPSVFITNFDNNISKANLIDYLHTFYISLIITYN